WRWDVPIRLAPAPASAASCSGRTLEGPQPKRPSAGLMSAGITMSATRPSVLSGRGGQAQSPHVEMCAPLDGTDRSSHCSYALPLRLAKWLDYDRFRWNAL